MSDYVVGRRRVFLSVFVLQPQRVRFLCPLSLIPCQLQLDGSKSDGLDHTAVVSHILERDFHIPASVSHILGRNHESFRQGRTIFVNYPEVPQ